MRINHNISSMIGQGALHTQQVSLGKSLEKAVHRSPHQPRLR